MNISTTDKVKSARGVMVGHVPARVMNDTFIIDEAFCLAKNDFKIMRESITLQTGVTLPYKSFENSSIAYIVFNDR